MDKVEELNNDVNKKVTAQNSSGSRDKKHSQVKQFKFGALVLALVLLFPLTACQKDSAAEESAASRRQEYLDSSENHDYRFDSFQTKPDADTAKAFISKNYPHIKYEYVSEEKLEEKENFNKYYDPEIIWHFHASEPAQFDFKVELTYSDLVSSKDAKDDKFYKGSLATDLGQKLLDHAWEELSADSANAANTQTTAETKASLEEGNSEGSKAEGSKAENASAAFSADELAKVRVLEQESTSAKPCLALDFSGKNDIKATVDLAYRLQGYLQAKVPDLQLNYAFFSELEEIQPGFKYFCGIYDLQKTDASMVKSEIGDKNLLFSVQNRLDDSLYSKDEILELIASERLGNHKFRVVNLLAKTSASSRENAETDNSSAADTSATNTSSSRVEYEAQTAYWQDLANNSYDAEAISMSTLYEVLNRIKWSSLEGDASAFKFTGVDGNNYEFSYEFVLPETEKTDSNVDDYFNGFEFYYLVNGVRTKYEYVPAQLNSINYQTFHHMTGLYLRNAWEENAKARENLEKNQNSQG